MRISLGQIIVLTLITFLLFGDLQSAQKKLKSVLKKTTEFTNGKSRKKGN